MLLTPEVYFYPTGPKSKDKELCRAVEALFDAAGFASVLPEKGLVAVKTHFGEGDGVGYIKPPVIATGVKLLKKRKLSPFVTDTNTLYRGNRHNAIDHIKQAADHGFTLDSLGCPVIISDGLRGNNDEEIEINCPHFSRVPIAGDIVRSDGLMVFSHLTGHESAGFGATIKNLAMGCAPRRGKLMQHAALKPWIKAEICTACGTCILWCPEDAITMQEKASIEKDKCIGCGECITVCPFGAVTFSWKQESVLLQEKMAEFALGAVKALKGRVVYFNVMTHITDYCDCWKVNQPAVVPDIGIAASTDPVALDRASLDLFANAHQKSIFDFCRKPNGLVQLEYAEKIGLGSNKYSLVRIGNA